MFLVLKGVKYSVLIMDMEFQKAHEQDLDIIQASAMVGLGPILLFDVTSVNSTPQHHVSPFIRSHELDIRGLDQSFDIIPDSPAVEQELYLRDCPNSEPEEISDIPDFSEPPEFAAGVSSILISDSDTTVPAAEIA